MIRISKFGHWVFIFTFSLLSLISCSTSENLEPDVLSVSFKDYSITLYYLETYQLQPIVKSGTFNPSKCIWKSSNEDVATVSENGIIEARTILYDDLSYGIGNTLISLYYNGRLLDTCKIIVVPPRPTSIDITNSEISLYAGEKTMLTYIVQFENNTDTNEYKDIIWESSDESIVTLSNDGEISALLPGQATITARINGHDLFDICKITVKEKYVTGVTCTSNINVRLGESEKINAIVEPEDATNKTIIWTSLNPNVAKVDKNGNVKGISLGETDIIAETEDRRFKANCHVKVVDLPDLITAFVRNGLYTNSGYTYFTLSLFFQTNTSDPVYLKSIDLIDNFGNIQNADYPNKYCCNFNKTYTIFGIYTPNGISGNTINQEQSKLKGWSFNIKYEWNSKEYETVCIN